MELETKEQLVELLESVIARLDAIETAGTEKPAEEATDGVEKTTDAEPTEDLDEIAKLLAL